MKAWLIISLHILIIYTGYFNLSWCMFTYIISLFSELCDSAPCICSKKQTNLPVGLIAKLNYPIWIIHCNNSALPATGAYIRTEVRAAVLRENCIFVLMTLHPHFFMRWICANTFSSSALIYVSIRSGCISMRCECTKWDHHLY